MKKYFLLFFILSIIPSYGQGQENKIYTATKYNVGFYKTYEEFLSNAPSVKIPMVVKKVNEVSECYRYETENKKKVKGYIFGFCDGVNIYVHGVATEGFHKIDYVGRYSLFTFKQPKNTIVTNILSDHLVIIDDKHGEYQKAKVNFVQRFLAKKNPDLSKEYESLDEKDKETKMHEYLIKLNEYFKAN